MEGQDLQARPTKKKSFHLLGRSLSTPAHSSMVIVRRLSQSVHVAAVASGHAHLQEQRFVIKVDYFCAENRALHKPLGGTLGTTLPQWRSSLPTLYAKAKTCGDCRGREQKHARGTYCLATESRDNLRLHRPLRPATYDHRAQVQRWPRLGSRRWRSCGRTSSPPGSCAAAA